MSFPKPWMMRLPEYCAVPAQAALANPTMKTSRTISRNLLRAIMISFVSHILFRRRSSGRRGGSVPAAVPESEGCSLELWIS
jgi:hypothetical protein